MLYGVTPTGLWYFIKKVWDFLKRNLFNLHKGIRVGLPSNHLFASNVNFEKERILLNIGKNNFFYSIKIFCFPYLSSFQVPMSTMLTLTMPMLHKD